MLGNIISTMQLINYIAKNPKFTKIAISDCVTAPLEAIEKLSSQPYNNDWIITSMLLNDTLTIEETPMNLNININSDISDIHTKMHFRYNHSTKSS